MKYLPKTIILTGGGSGGHITPLLSLAHELKLRSADNQIIYVGHKGDNFDTLKEVSHDFDFMAFVKAGKFRRYYNQNLLISIFDLKTLALNIRDFFRIPLSTYTAVKILRKFRPDVVFSKGSFVAVPICLAAKLLKIPIVTHDSDTVPGLANRIVGKWAKVHATGMPAEYYTYRKSKVRYVGIPIDKQIKKVTPKIQNQSKAKLGLPEESQVLLVSGGGNGSKHMNQLMLKIAGELLTNNLSLYIIHLSGTAHEQDVREGYKDLPKTSQNRVVVQAFTNDFYTNAAAADLIIGRAGATTLAELAAAGKACIIIPAPFLVGGHQLKNAEELIKRDAAVVIDEQVQSDELLALINNLLSNDHRRFELARNLYSTAKLDASKQLAELILEVANKK